MVREEIVENVKKYLAALLDAGLEPSFGVVFGSFATGHDHKWSDIDLMVVAKRFDGKYEYKYRTLLWITAGKVDWRIEPIPCGERQWEEDDGTPIIEIARREGVVVRID
ncbi:MAG: nucleotidyltransferase domain-containing protein [Calditrichota bacterium]